MLHQLRLLNGEWKLKRNSVFTIMKKAQDFNAGDCVLLEYDNETVERLEHNLKINADDQRTRWKAFLDARNKLFTVKGKPEIFKQTVELNEFPFRVGAMELTLVTPVIIAKIRIKNESNS